MIQTHELAGLIQREREHAVRHRRLARIARSARTCCAAPANLAVRLYSLFRPVPQSC